MKPKSNNVFLLLVLLLLSMTLFAQIKVPTKEIKEKEYLESAKNELQEKEVIYSLIEDIKTVSNSYYLLKEQLNISSRARREISTIDENNQITKEKPKSNEIYFIILGVIILIGIILGFTKTIVVYRDYADLTKTLFLFALPLGAMYIGIFIQNIEYKNYIIYTVLSILSVIFVWIVITTQRDNKNIIWTIFALCVKIPLALLFILSLMQLVFPSKNKTYREKNEDRIKALTVLVFVLGLVRNKEWSVGDRFFPLKLKELIFPTILLSFIVIGGYLYFTDYEERAVNIPQNTQTEEYQNHIDSISISKKEKAVQENSVVDKNQKKTEGLNSFKGKYIIASKRYLTDDDLRNLSTTELKIMRNEIFARHGYIFKKNGQMDKYFSRQRWYNPQHKDVKNLLTQIEKKNIRMIIQYENTKLKEKY